MIQLEIWILVVRSHSHRSPGIHELLANHLCTAELCIK